MALLRRDFLIHAEKDGQAIFNALGAREKKLLWIEKSNQRFYATTISGSVLSAWLIVRLAHARSSVNAAREGNTGRTG